MRYTIVIQLADHVIVMYKYVHTYVHTYVHAYVCMYESSFAYYLVSYEFDDLTDCYTTLLYKALLYKIMLYKILL